MARPEARVMLDTNVLLSAFASPGGVCRRLTDLIRDEDELRLVLCPHILGEFREKAVKKIKLAPDAARLAAEELEAVAQVVPDGDPAAVRRYALRDPDDEPILAAAVAAHATMLVTGDRDLLDVADPPLPIVRPREAFGRLGGA